METEVHVFAFSVSANVLLSFFPFLIVMASITQQVLHWDAATGAIYDALNSYFPRVIEEWLRLGEAHAHNGLVSVVSRHKFQLVSILLLLFTANGIFEPLEVALNKVWGCKVNRSFVRNQALSLGLIFVCGTLAMLSTMFTGMNHMWTGTFPAPVAGFFTAAFVELVALPVSMFVLFLIYWLLPNCKVRPVDVIPAAIFVGFLLEVLKWVNRISWVWMQQKMRREYGPFQYSVTLILWSFFASMLILAGAEWSARKARERAN
jgi:YihY family inner membrane protein